MSSEGVANGPTTQKTSAKILEWPDTLARIGTGATHMCNKEFFS